LASRSQKVGFFLKLRVTADQKMRAGSEDAPPIRYYAGPHEQKILIQGLQNYFSLPERSANRNKIARDVSNFLQMDSPHWTHRAVRRWFNYNRHTYLSLRAPNPDPAQLPLDPR
jgi:hypothetical protein